jgi:Ca2+-binding RTX toxin-like protein
MALIIGTSDDDTLVGTALNDTLNGLDGDDLLQGLDGNDSLFGASDDDTLEGNNGNDKLFGGDDDDYLDGGDGNDTLAGEDDDDTLVGGNGNDTLFGLEDDDTLIGSAGADTLNGGQGSDTASYEGSGSGVNVNLSTGVASGGDATGDRLSEIENLAGSDKNDTLVGDDGDNILSGGGGADSLDGGQGNDTASYEGSGSGVNVNLSTGVASGGDATGDRLSEIENLIGSAHNDTLVGDNGDNILSGGGGADSLNGGQGNDTASYEDSDSGVNVNLSTGQGSGGDATGDSLVSIENLIGSDEDDTLIGDNSNNSISAEEGDDLLIGGAGADPLDGGDDEDTASYANSALGVNVDLATGVGNGGDATGDKLENIENLIGSAQNDTLTGNSDDNILSGGSGNDSLLGNEGVDTLEGGAGADPLDGGDDEDTASYANSALGVNVDLATGVGNGGDATGDKLENIENLIGSAQNDTLTGNNDDNILSGSSGNDSLFGNEGDDSLEGGIGADSLNGGLGSDTASYENSELGVSVNLSTGTGSGGDAEGDTLAEIENLIGSAQNDTLIGNDSANTLNGGGGADFLDGGAGNDTANYDNSESGVNVNLSTGNGSGGDAEGDTLLNIENLIGSSDDDNTLIGNSGDNLLIGGDEEDLLQGEGGNDSLYGGLEQDILSGGRGDDLLRGEADFDSLDGGQGRDSLFGGSGGDTLVGGSDGDLLDGGADIDTASYAGSSSGVSIDLTTGAFGGGDATGDTLVSIENLTGSSNSDTLKGDSLNNILEGGGGADFLDGGTGSDKASYASSVSGVSVNLLTGAFGGGDAQGDTLVNIENLFGSGNNDTLVGNDSANILEGLAGDDLLQGNGGNDTIYGLEGNDTIEGGSGDDLLEGDEGNDFLSGGENNDLLFGGFGNDILEGGSDINFLSGDAGDDRLVGGAVNDTLLGGSENDTLLGDAGTDTLNGGSENDYLDGGLDNDQLVGATGNDTLKGDSGNDILEGGIGTDTLTGGDGSDIFKFNFRQDSTLDQGFDTITDLEIGTDIIDGLQAVSADEVAQLGAVSSLDESGIASVLTNDAFAANKAATFTFANQTFLAINDGTAGFNSSNDGLIEITGFTGDLANLALANNSQVPSTPAPLPASSLPQTEVAWKNEQLTPKKTLIDDPSKIQEAIANAQPGDTLVLKDGVYRDLNVYLNKPGITFRAQTAGGVTITGDSDIYIEQDHITVSGFKFDQITSGDMPIVHFVGANYSRFTNSAFNDSGVGVKDRIIQLRTDSQYNRVDRNSMDGNLSIGISVAGTRSRSRTREGVEQLSDWYNRIERNYIKDIPYPGGDVNGREAIQLGNLADEGDVGITGRSVAEYNLLENVDYDPEAISVKTSENRIRFNTLRGSENGGLVVRSGDDNLVEGNFIFDTNDGIRVNGSNNQILNNYIEGSETGIRIRPRDPSTNITIANNTIVNTTDVGINASAEPGIPWSANIYNNTWQSDSGTLLDSSLSLSEVNWANNIVSLQGTAKVGTLPPTGVIQTDPRLVESGGIFRLAPNSPAVNAGISVDGVTFDIDRQPRDAQVDIGADELSGASIDNKPLNPTDVGSFWTDGKKGQKLSANTGETLFGSNDNDSLDASDGGGNNRLFGGNGNDEVILGSNDRGFGGSGNDFFEAKYGSGNLLFGDSGNDQITVNTVRLRSQTM